MHIKVLAIPVAGVERFTDLDLNKDGGPSQLEMVAYSALLSDTVMNVSIKSGENDIRGQIDARTQTAYLGSRMTGSSAVTVERE